MYANIVLKKALRSTNKNIQVNPQLKGHLKGAVNNGATVEEVRAVRDIVVQVCEASGMSTIKEETRGGWGWRGEVAKI